MSNCAVADCEDDNDSIVIDTDSGLHIIPRRFFTDIALGKLSINEIDCYESIIRAMIGDLMMKGVL